MEHKTWQIQIPPHSAPLQRSLNRGLACFTYLSPASRGAFSCAEGALEDIVKTYWPQLLALLAFVAWLIRLEAAVKGQAQIIGELRREQAEITRRAQDQAVTLARMDESLAAIKKTLDRLVERMERRT